MFQLKRQKQLKSYCLKVTIMLQIGTHGTRVSIVCTRVSTRASKNARRANWRMFQM